MNIYIQKQLFFIVILLSIYLFFDNHIIKIFTFFILSLVSLQLIQYRFGNDGFILLVIICLYIFTTIYFLNAFSTFLLGANLMTFLGKPFEPKNIYSVSNFRKKYGHIFTWLGSVIIIISIYTAIFY